MKPNILSRLADFLIYSFLIVLAVSCIYPFIYTIAVSLSDQHAIITMKVVAWPVGFQIASYKSFLHDINFYRSFLNTVYVTALGTTINLIMTTITAYPLSKRGFRGGSLIMKLIVFTMLFSGGTIPSYLLIKNLHMIDSFWALMLPGAINTFNLIIMKTFFAGIPKELEEAATIDGCNELQILIRIYIPLSLTVMATLGLFYAVNHWNSYMNALIYINDIKKFTLQVKLKQLLVDDQFTQTGGLSGDDHNTVIQESLKSAIIVISTIPMLVIYPFLQKYFVKGVMVGAVKG